MIRKSSLEVSRGFGIFKKTVFMAVEISPPNPPQSYCKQLYVIYEDGIRFFFVGSSKAFSERNNFKAAMNDTGGNLKAKTRAFLALRLTKKHLSKRWSGTTQFMLLLFHYLNKKKGNIY